MGYTAHVSVVRNRSRHFPEILLGRLASYRRQTRDFFSGGGGEFQLLESESDHALPSSAQVNPLNPELNPICYLLSLLAHNFLHVSRIRAKLLTLRLLMSYIYIYIYDISNLRVKKACSYTHTCTHFFMTLRLTKTG